MKCIVAIALLAALAVASPMDGFRTWARANNKVYTGREEARRFAIFKESLAIIERLRIDHPETEFSLNQFSDLTNQEFAALYANGLTEKVDASGIEVVADNVNAEADYTYMLPAVKDQASCGSCWAFSAVANMEGQTYKNNGGKVVSLSEQQLVSCDKSNSGCNGGSMVYADMYAVKNGMASEAAYPYVSGTGTVPACKSFKVVAEFSSYHNYGKVASDSTMISHLDTFGPMSIGIEADTVYFQYYSSGILDNPTSCGTNLDHGVTLVGYGTESGKNFWLVRNSWGKSWGDSGYVKLIRGKNMCGMNGMVSTIVA